MKRILFQFLLLLPVPAVNAQQAVIAGIAGAQKEGNLNFPVVSLPDKAVARKINDYLQINVLEQTSLKAPGIQVFDKVKWTEKNNGYDELGYTVTANNANLLCIGIASEWMAAYPNSFVQYFVFNAQNGEIVFPEDIFTAQGIKYLAEDLKIKRSKRIAAQLQKLKTNPDVADNLEDMKGDFERCNGNAGLETFYVTATGIVFYRPACLPHVQAEFDTDMAITYSFEQVRPRLSSFGQKLFNPVKQDISKDSFPSLYKPLRGKIDNKYDIMMQFKVYPDHSASGFYYYNNYQAAIDLSGKLENGVLELKEHDKDYNDTAVFNATVSGTMLTGTWTNLKTGKAMPFTVRN